MQGNVRSPGPKEKLAVTLDGRQIASVVVGALVILAVVFVLGLNVGRQIGARQAEASRAGSLEALDKAPRAAPVPESSLTFHDRLTTAKPEAKPPPAAATAPAQPPPAQSQAQAPAAPPAATTPSPDPAAPAPRPAAEPAGAYTVQLGASSDRAEAERIAGKFEAYNPRVEGADVQGRRVWRVRVGSFESREAAARFLSDVSRETGAQGWVTSSR